MPALRTVVLCTQNCTADFPSQVLPHIALHVSCVAAVQQDPCVPGLLTKLRGGRGRAEGLKQAHSSYVDNVERERREREQRRQNDERRRREDVRPNSPVCVSGMHAIAHASLLSARQGR